MVSVAERREGDDTVTSTWPDLAVDCRMARHFPLNALRCFAFEALVAVWVSIVNADDLCFALDVKCDEIVRDRHQAPALILDLHSNVGHIAAVAISLFRSADTRILAGSPVVEISIVATVLPPLVPTALSVPCSYARPRSSAGRM